MQVNEVCQWKDCVGYLYLVGWSGDVAEPIGSSVPVRVPAYEDGTDSEFRNVGN